VSGLTLSTTANASSAIGGYPVIPASATASNYTIMFVNGLLNVEAAQNPLPITPAAIVTEGQILPVATNDGTLLMTSSDVVVVVGGQEELFSYNGAAATGPSVTAEVAAMLTDSTSQLNLEAGLAPASVDGVTPHENVPHPEEQQVGAAKAYGVFWIENPALVGSIYKQFGNLLAGSSSYDYQPESKAAPANHPAAGRL